MVSKQWKTELCISCNTELAAFKKRKLCKKCYGRIKYREKAGDIRFSAEVEFIKNFFNHKNWVYQPACFRMNEERYTPDFYDGERNVFIEVVGTRQAFHKNFNKYKLFIKTFPLIKFEIRNVSGEIRPLTKKVYAKRQSNGENKLKI